MNANELGCVCMNLSYCTKQYILLPDSTPG